MNPTEKNKDQKSEQSGALAPPKNVIRIDEGVIREHLDEVVTRTVEETLNALLEAEADRLCGAPHSEHGSQLFAIGRPQRIQGRIFAPD